MNLEYFNCVQVKVTQILGKFSHNMHNQMQTKQKLLQTSQDN